MFRNRGIKDWSEGKNLLNSLEDRVRLDIQSLINQNFKNQKNYRKLNYN